MAKTSVRCDVCGAPATRLQNDHPRCATHGSRTPEEDLFDAAIEPELPPEFSRRLWTVLVSVVLGEDESSLYDNLTKHFGTNVDVETARTQIATARRVASALVTLCDAADRVVDAHAAKGRPTRGDGQADV